MLFAITFQVPWVTSKPYAVQASLNHAWSATTCTWLTRDELVGVVDALHLAGDQALEQRFAEILHQLPPPPLFRPS